MFGKKNDPSPLKNTAISSFIAGAVTVQGDICFADGLRIDGEVQGSISNRPGEQGLLVVSEKGFINGNIVVYDAVINGRIEGDLEVIHFLELQPKASIKGNIRYHQLQMACGAQVQGQLEHRPDPEQAKVLELPHVSEQNAA